MMEELIFEEDDEFESSKEAERDYWEGRGHIELYVSLNRPDVFEYEVEDYSGCVGGAHETFCGYDYFLEHLGIDKATMKEGCSYVIEGITVYFTLGDGWTTDDDADYDYEKITMHWKLGRWLKQWVSNAWWCNIGWRIRDWRSK